MKGTLCLAAAMMTKEERFQYLALRASCHEVSLSREAEVVRWW